MPYEKPKKKSSTENDVEELLKDGVKAENITEEPKSKNFGTEKIENEDEETEEIEDEELKIPKPEGNKGTQSSNYSLRCSSTFGSSVSDVNDILR